MTRYARAKGSKACNSKKNCSATPWQIFKEQFNSDIDHDTETVKSREGGGKVTDFKVDWYDFTSDLKCKHVDKHEISEKSKARSIHKIKHTNLPSEWSRDLSRKNPVGVVDITSSSAKVIKKLDPINKMKGKIFEKPAAEIGNRKSLTEKRNTHKVFTQSGHFTVVDDVFLPQVSTREEVIKKFDSDLKDSRRKEKAVKREKKKVCFCCRRWGHKLSECPEAHSGNKVDIIEMPSSICYNCGSTEHKITNCSKPGRKSQKFARCFVCGALGHLARLCPENSKGNYPKGGSCLICGEVNHLRVDCPRANQESGKRGSLLTCVRSGPIESLLEDMPTKFSAVKSKRILKF